MLLNSFYSLVVVDTLLPVANQGLAIPLDSPSASLFGRKKLVYSEEAPSFLSFFKRSITFSWIQGVVDKANPILSGTANRAKFTKANASAPSFCKSSLFDKSGQWLREINQVV